MHQPLTAAAEQLVNRRVLLLDFVNQKNSDNASYLSVSIPEAYIDPLQKTGVFEVMNRSNGQKKAAELKISPNDLYNEDNALKIGAALQADVVVIGNYVAVGTTVQIQAKALDIAAGRIAVSKSVQAKLDATIFGSITLLAEGMSLSMKQALPPLPQREVVREKIVIREGEKEQVKVPKPRWYFSGGAGATTLFPDSNLGFGIIEAPPTFAALLGFGRNFGETWSVGLDLMYSAGKANEQARSCTALKGCSQMSTRYMHAAALGKFFVLGGLSLQLGLGLGHYKYDATSFLAFSNGSVNTAPAIGDKFGFSVSPRISYQFALVGNFNIGFQGGVIYLTRDPEPVKMIFLAVIAEY